MTTPATATVTALLIPGEFSLSDDAHQTDFEAVLQFAQNRSVDLIGGTEATASRRNNTAAVLEDLGPKHGYRVRVDPNGEWVGVRRSFGGIVDSGFDPVIPAVHGPASAGGHAVRGIKWITVQPTTTRLGRVSVLAAHFATMGLDETTTRGRENARLAEALAAKQVHLSRGTDWSLSMSDTNMDDEHRDRLDPKVVRSCWDDQGHWPTTHPHPDGNGPTLDVIYLANRDGRVDFTQANAISDARLPLRLDHYPVLVRLGVKLLPA